MISSTFPYPPTRGGTQVRTFNLLKYLSQQNSITVVTQQSPDVTEEDMAGLRQWVDEVMIFPRPKSRGKGSILGKVKRFSQFLIQGTPPSVQSNYSKAMQHWIDKFVQAGKYEAITCEHSANEIYVRPEWKQQLKTVVNVQRCSYLKTLLNEDNS